MIIWKVRYRLNDNIEEIYVAVNSYSEFWEYMLSLLIEEDDIISIEKIKIENL